MYELTSCHPLGGGDPVENSLDSRFRGNDGKNVCNFVIHFVSLP